MDSLIVLGARGFEVLAVLDDDHSKHGQPVLGVPAQGGLERALEFNDVWAVVGVGNNADRQSVATRLDTPYALLTHPSAMVAESVDIGAGVVVCAGAVVQTGTTLEQRVIVNTGATVDHDCWMAPFAQIGPGATMCGGVFVGGGAMIGAGRRSCWACGWVRGRLFGWALWWSMTCTRIALSQVCPRGRSAVRSCHSSRDSAGLRCPFLDVGPIPDQCRLELCNGLREVVVARAPVVDGLGSSHIETICDLGGAHELLGVNTSTHRAAI